MDAPLIVLIAVTIDQIQRKLVLLLRRFCFILRAQPDLTEHIRDE